MTLVGKKDAILLFLGDILIFGVALYVALLARYQELPDWERFYNNFSAFLPVFFIWNLIFFMFGLYDRQTTALKRKLPDLIFNTFIFNGIIALLFFYLFPVSNITPKTNLLLCLLFSVVFVSFWRIYLFDFFRSSRIGNILVVGDSKEIMDIKTEIEKNKSYGMNPIWVKNLNDEVINKTKEFKTKNIIADLKNAKNLENIQTINKLLFSGDNLIGAEEVYENIFDKISLSCIDNDWFIQNKPNNPKILYDIFKRMTDIFISFVLGLVSFVFYPFVYLAIKLDDGGPVLFTQERVGKNGKSIKIIKFRTMSAIDSGKWVVKDDPRITRVGNFLRKSRIDELPQLWNVLMGDISLIGPRPEIFKFVDLYEKEIPFYNMRHLIKPGLSGWAQIHHEKPPQSVEETKEKLSYDLYYLKNRTIMLDFEIGLKTIKTLLSRTGM